MNTTVLFIIHLNCVQFKPAFCLNTIFWLSDYEFSFCLIIFLTFSGIQNTHTLSIYHVYQLVYYRVCDASILNATENIHKKRFIHFVPIFFFSFHGALISTITSTYSPFYICCSIANATFWCPSKWLLVCSTLLALSSKTLWPTEPFPFSCAQRFLFGWFGFFLFL